MTDTPISVDEYLATPNAVFADKPDAWGHHAVYDPKRTSSKLWSTR